MGMLVTIDIVDSNVNEEIFKEVFKYLNTIDKKFSPYKRNSELTLYNNKKIEKENLSNDFKQIISFSEDMRKRTNGFFNILHSFRFSKRLGNS